ncbi:MAG: LamG domain-containing protein [Bacteroidia bacterium]|nr:LamG domain-containing protein [Bacteroidia bacterium]
MNKPLVKSLIVAVGLFFLFSNGMGQDYYWTFEGGNELTDLKQKKEIVVKKGRVELAKDLDNRSYLKANCGTSGNIQLCEVPPVKQFSMEFLIRYDMKDCGHSPNVIFGNYSSVVFRIMQGFVGFYNNLETEKGRRSIYTTEKLMGTDRKSISYYLDGNWHHIAFVFDGINGTGGVWVDGKKIATNQESLKGYSMSKKPFFLNIDQHFAGDLDDIAIYYRSISPFEIAKHASASLAGKEYGTEVKMRNFQVENAGSKAKIDIKEFAPGHPVVSLSPYQQLDDFPYPRYKKDHQLMPLFNWMGIPFIGGFKQDGIKDEQASANSAAITELMADKYHYALVIPNSKSISVGKPLSSQYVVVRDMVNLANRRKDLPLGMISLWLQTKMTLLEGEEQFSPYVARKNLPDEYYMKNDKGQFIQANGVPHETIRWLSPSAPGELFKKEGQVQKMYFNHWLKLLDRPIDIINENGEAPPYEWREKVREVDPAADAHFKKSGIKDWDEYAAKQKLRFRKNYSDPFIKDIPGLKNTLFTWYGVDAGPLNRFQWKESRYISSQINGQYYSTPDFYPRYPDNWRKWKGPWRGWEWLVVCRKIEINQGDKLFSPFIGAGWEKDPVRNIRPSQWLGLLKLLGPIGAEFYYTGFFNETPWGHQGKFTFPNPKNYIWQAALPAYAQALTSHYEDILREGDVLYDAKGDPIIHTAVNDPRFLVAVRKAKNEDRYIIAGGIFPLSNLPGQVPEEGEVWVPIGNQKYKMCFRRQGSVYELNLSGTKAVIRQLDSWHETGHPSYWSTDLSFEAEVYDKEKGTLMQTAWTSAVSENELTNFQTYIRAKNSKAKLEYSFIPKKDSKRFEVELKAQNRTGKVGLVDIGINGSRKGSLKLKKGGWNRYTLKINEVLKKGETYDLFLELKKTGLEIDSFVIRQL